MSNDEDSKINKYKSLLGSTKDTKEGNKSSKNELLEFINERQLNKSEPLIPSKFKDPDKLNEIKKKFTESKEFFDNKKNDLIDYKEQRKQLKEKLQQVRYYTGCLYLFMTFSAMILVVKGKLKLNALNVVIAPFFITSTIYSCFAIKYERENKKELEKLKNEREESKKV